MTAACLVCGAAVFEPYLGDLRRCRACGFVTAELDAAPDAAALYGDGYFQGEEYLDYERDKVFLQRNFGQRLADVTKRVPGGRLLEIGSAYGFFLDLARAHFDVVGYEVNRTAARHAREVLGLDVRTGDFLYGDDDDGSAPFDAVVMWDVVEHLARPDRFLARIARLTRPGAALFITTGDVGSLVARWRGRRWRMIHPPTHLHYFSRATLTRLLARQGFCTVETRAIPVARSIRQMLYSVLVLRLGQPRLYEAVAARVPATWGIGLNTFDIMLMVAERAEEGASRPPS